MADPFPDVKLRYSNVHPSIDVETEEEEEEEEEAEMLTIDASTLTDIDGLSDVMFNDSSCTSPDV